MRIRLQELEHQSRAIAALRHVFDAAALSTDPAMTEANPIIDRRHPGIRDAIRELQEGRVEGLRPIPRAWRTRHDGDALGLDIRMETGTGKTYVYTRMMHELHSRFGFTKFIVLVPGLAIREGARSFMASDYARQHFDDLYRGTSRLELSVLEAQRASKGRKLFPPAITDFAGSSRLHRTQLSALLMSDGMLLSDRTMAYSYDQMILGSASVPYDALRATRPIVIIDEPHRFQRGNRAFTRLVERIDPQAIIRFGATFPTAGGGRPDFDNLIFSLGAIESFNDMLVKGVSVEYPDAVDESAARLKLMGASLAKPKSATFRDERTKRSFEFSVGADLAEVHGDFAGIRIERIGATELASVRSGVTLSNSQVLAKGDVIASGIYSDTYQGLMMERAIANHLDSERENFMRSTRVKTLTLFFIDDIRSYRVDGEPGHLRIRFEELLAAELRRRLPAARSDDSVRGREYAAYLEASLQDIRATNGGYFSADNSSKDADIQREVDQILRDKQSLLSFEAGGGSWNTRRFVFSKWTLREGWDNPNVFQIVKMRSSGSDVSKIQEVGRGLRLPVDEHGRRLSGEQFYLTYLVDHSERAFASRLIGEIDETGDVGDASISDRLAKVAALRDMTEAALLAELLQAELVDVEMRIVDGREAALFESYPEFRQGLDPDKVVETRPTVGVRPAQFTRLRPLWEAINQRYYLQLDELGQAQIDACIDAVLSASGSDDVDQRDVGHVVQDRLVADGAGLAVRSSLVKEFERAQQLPFGQWLASAHRQTLLPVDRLHAGLLRRNAARELPRDFFSHGSLARFVRKTRSWLFDHAPVGFAYRRIEHPPRANRLVDAGGSPVESVVQGSVGRLRSTSSAVPETFLYDAVVYDSPKELATILESNSARGVAAFAKIPQRSVRIPLPFGGTSSPDFMFVVEYENGSQELFVIVETKDIADDRQLRIEERARIAAMRQFVQSMQDEGIPARFSPQTGDEPIAARLASVAR